MDQPQKNNELTATVLFTSGNQLIVHAKGKAPMGCDIFGLSWGVTATDDVNGTISLSTPLRCIKSPGTYVGITVSYTRYPATQSSPIYNNDRRENGVITHPGEVTFTIADDKHWEGSFNTVCWSNTDSVVIKGTFSGVNF
jgi:hypothetical protein